MFRLSKFQTKILLLLRLIGFIILGSFLKDRIALNGVNTIEHSLPATPIASKVILSESSDVEFAPLQQWFEAGSRPQDYAMGADLREKRNGRASGTIQAQPGAIKGFGTLMQVFDASTYRGQRLRLRGYVKAEAVEDWAGLWMRVDGTSGQVLSFDNMQQRPIKGSNDWQSYDIVLDVPVASKNIAFGLLLSGSGQVWMDDLQFEVVDTEIPTTNLENTQSSSQSPANLSFETLNE
ncbi:conserved hypothetical protein [Hyella patelloides LEGE 07179]|uniref:Uncharacterized protein n=1 Tax=Hyella patelloides LEGE 07179 TaxID=945734 RepID=A0A563VWE3_9CYAN|nr:hypothetical protein [Hyella patelloides]VEP15778.1 conserved hypothetical protein [Hyella patelloides LEGE 07179]